MELGFWKQSLSLCDFLLAHVFRDEAASTAFPEYPETARCRGQPYETKNKNS
jgi:hypothetical protein